MKYLSKFEDENNWKTLDLNEDKNSSIKSYSDFIIEDKTEDIEVISEDETDSVTSSSDVE
jgi:hypothetical protein